MSEPVDVQAERLRELAALTEQARAVLVEHGCATCENTVRDFMDAALALLAGQAEQIEWREDARREAVQAQIDAEAREAAAVRQRDNLRDALREILELPNALTTRSVQVRAKQALRAAAVGEDE